MKILKAKSQTPKSVTKTSSPKKGAWRKNNHSIRKRLEAKGFAAIQAGTYVENTLDVVAAEATAERKAEIRREAIKPCSVIIEGTKGYFAFQGKTDKRDSVLLPDGKVFNVKALPLAKVAVLSNDKLIAEVSRRGKPMQLSFRTKDGRESVTGHVMLNPKQNYGFIVDADDNSIRNFELKSNKYNQGKVASVIR